MHEDSLKVKQETMNHKNTHVNLDVQILYNRNIEKIESFCMKTVITLQITRNFKLLGLMHDDGKSLADDARITIGSRIRRVSFLHHI